ncbi:hypothetical protein Acsp06_37350 [Actinomycetospora sp. NBRC 106375]|uniref:DUF5313 family protein n=1 Tax=Actinomycetospora sp. NBRC 106375 TaxID=3032207 RepID=UPI00249FC96F|nr:DUF5313 family protein [Actinomycetospora sp. NBRC 106375]GLZ47550.1 hypothetical protein Acsp06_37350 [Actinomycetospora sp. NBRC 106375]
MPGPNATRPNPLQWPWYAYGGGLPARCAPWVLHDTTCRTWWVRHLLRAVVQIAPFVIAIIVFVPGPLWLRTMCALGGAIMGLIFSVSYLHETAEHRLVKAGYPPGTGPAARAERTADRDAAAAERYAARYRTPPGS